jgi:hypothetical protein
VAGKKSEKGGNPFVIRKKPLHNCRILLSYYPYCHNDLITENFQNKQHKTCRTQCDWVMSGATTLTSCHQQWPIAYLPPT